MATEQIEIRDHWDLDAFRRELDAVQHLTDDQVGDLARRYAREMHRPRRPGPRLAQPKLRARSPDIVLGPSPVTRAALVGLA